MRTYSIERLYGLNAYLEHHRWSGTRNLLLTLVVTYAWILFLNAVASVDYSMPSVYGYSATSILTSVLLLISARNCLRWQLSETSMALLSTKRLAIVGVVTTTLHLIISFLAIYIEFLFLGGALQLVVFFLVFYIIVARHLPPTVTIPMRHMALIAFVHWLMIVVFVGIFFVGKLEIVYYFVLQGITPVLLRFVCERVHQAVLDRCYRFTKFPIDRIPELSALTTRFAYALFSIQCLQYPGHTWAVITGLILNFVLDVGLIAWQLYRVNKQSKRVRQLRFQVSSTSNETLVPMAVALSKQTDQLDARMLSAHVMLHSDIATHVADEIKNPTFLKTYNTQYTKSSQKIHVTTAESTSQVTGPSDLQPVSNPLKTELLLQQLALLHQSERFALHVFATIVAPLYNALGSFTTVFLVASGGYYYRELDSIVLSAMYLVALTLVVACMLCCASPVVRRLLTGRLLGFVLTHQWSTIMLQLMLWCYTLLRLGRYIQY